MKAAAGADHSAALIAALAYAEQGLRVHPVNAVTKAPLTTYGHLDATINAGTIRQWWTFWPEAGIGVALAASGLVDVAPDAPDHRAEFERRGLPTAARFQSPGGEGHVHHLFRRPAGCPTARICRSGEYDILSDGYAILPNGDGSRTWLGEPPNLNGGLPEAPTWVVEALRERTARRAAASAPAPADAADEPPVVLVGEALAVWQGRSPKVKPNGDVDRSASLLKTGRVLYDAGMTRRGVVAELRERDHALGWHKYCCRSDGDRRYHEIVDELERDGRTEDAGEPAGRDAVVAELTDVIGGLRAILYSEATASAKVGAAVLALEIHRDRTEDLLSLPAIARRAHVSEDTLAGVRNAYAEADGPFRLTPVYRRVNPYTGREDAEPHRYVQATPVRALLSETLRAIADDVPETLCRKPRPAREPRAPVTLMPPDETPPCPEDRDGGTLVRAEAVEVTRCEDCGLPLAARTADGAVLTLPLPQGAEEYSTVLSSAPCGSGPPHSGRAFFETLRGGP